MVAEVVYCCLLMNSNTLFSSSESGYLIPTIFWANFGLPFLVEHFYLGELSMHPNPNLKLKLFPYIIFGLMCSSLLESMLFLVLMSLKVLLLYIYYRQGYEMFHVRQLIKLILLVLVAFYAMVKFIVMDFSNLFTWSAINTTGSMLGCVFLMTGAMLISRLIALIFLKHELYKYFYTELHVQLGFIFSAMVMYASYISLEEMASRPQVYSFVALIFLSLIGVLVFMEGKERLEVCI